ncbi:ribosomal protein L17 [Coccomyxa subellipsoidea C-169]|uniref:Large ribosomal subunit protein bL17c n=1 Tax=Coccomyxa subellipsoidea (strain C-169) TaxID=574566 RepID=I0YR80_COCSC|nr:ribosomal protein L17 [Coccomyxa subellipsoidea C-169]EIE20899.1 ribosomal protein L17 [Coccomyxa subellipsoidea C-169]|eukprot:XP_005645443.1 ribosomal protein L17 [Coccomyxa subellipsoidea C-169]
MKHRVVGRNLGRTVAHRWSLLRTMVSQLVRHERIETTVAKAKELRKLADRVITWGKEGDLHARRKAAAVVRGDDVLQKVFTEMAERYKDRDGGYTRILRTRQRTNDAAHMAYIEYVDRDGELRPARPPPGRQSPFLPAAAQALEQQPGGQEEPADRS